MKKSFIIKIIFFTCIFSKILIAGDNDRIIQSNILGAVSSLILPTKASVAISLLPYLTGNETEVSSNIIDENIVPKNNSSISYTSSINYINTLTE